MHKILNRLKHLNIIWHTAEYWKFSIFFRKFCIYTTKCIIQAGVSVSRESCQSNHTKPLYGPWHSRNPHFSVADIT